MTTQDELRYMVWSYLALAGASVVLLALLWQFRPGLWRRLLPLPRLRPGNWSGGIVVLAFLFEQLCLLLAAYVVLGAQEGPNGLDPAAGGLETKLKHALILSSPLFLVICLPALLRLLARGTGTPPRQLGVTRARWAANVTLGLLAFLVSAPAVGGVYALVVLFIPAGHYPFEDLVQQDFPVWEWWLLGFQVVVVAPVIEELLFRGILQGWLRRATLPGHVIVMIVAMMKALAEGDDPGPRIFAGVLVALYAAALYWLYRRYLPADATLTAWNLPPREPDEEEDLPPRPDEEELLAASEQDWQRWQVVNARLAVLGSAMLFAVFHSAVWPTPIPLFLLGLVLGWLAYRTQSLLGPVIVHALFNAVSILALYGLATSAGATKGKDETVAQRPAPAASTCSCVPGAWLPRRR